MSLFEDVQNLPGVICEINSDYSLGYDTSKFGTTDSVIVVGTSFKGKPGTMYPIYSPEHAAYIFGEAYNSETKKEATLTAGLKAAYDSGCRTLYGVRVSGKDIYKDFNLCTDSKLKLRVQSYTPHNVKKECYILFDLTSGAEKLTLYKPAADATMEEKSAGDVDSSSAIMKVEMELNLEYGYNVNSKLSDVINEFNKHACNLSLKLMLVDEDGNDVTTSQGAYEIALGALYPGVYFIGREKSLCQKETEQKFVLVSGNTVKPYNDFEGVYFRKLVLNTDVSKPLPIYYSDIATMRSILKKVEITMAKPWDFLAVAEATDKAFAPDNVDYEEVDISKFELYQKLGSGYVTTAMAERRSDDTGKDITPRIKQTPTSDPNAIEQISDGIYPMLENETSKYRVLTFGCADDELTDELPKAKDFMTMLSNSARMFQDSLIATAKVDANNRESAKAYTFRFESLSNTGVDNESDIYTDVIAKTISSVTDVAHITAKAVETGTLVMLIDTATGIGHLKRVTDSGYESLDGAGLVDDLFIVNSTLYSGDASTGSVVFAPAAVKTNAAGNPSYKTKEYVLGECNDTVYAYQAVNGTPNLKPLGDLNGMLSNDESQVLVYLETNPFGVNQVIVRSAAFTATTFTELIEYLNDHASLGKYFSFEIAEDFSAQKDDIVTDVITTGFNVDYPLAFDRELVYDYTKYIPYKTTDNLARQFAQHCISTEIRTSATHGIIGVNTITNTSSKGVADRVTKLRALDLDLYAKTVTGRRMLDQNSQPYPIGKNISIPVFQIPVTMNDNYVFTSNGATSYAGMISKLPLDQSSTNQPIILSGTPAYKLTNYQLGKLTEKGFITIKDTITLGYVITDGITMAPATNRFRRLSISRIMGGVEELIRAACEPYIGKVNNTAYRNAMQTAIKSSLDDVKDILIYDYSFSMNTDAATAKLNNVAISYIIIPLYEIRQVKNTFTIKDQS